MLSFYAIWLFLVCILPNGLLDKYSLIWFHSGWREGMGGGEGREIYRKVTVSVWFCKLSLNVLMFVTAVVGYINGPKIE